MGDATGIRAKGGQKAESLTDMNDDHLSIQTVRIEGPESLGQGLRSANAEIVQLQPGKLEGSRTRIGVGNLSVLLTTCIFPQ